MTVTGDREHQLERMRWDASARRRVGPSGLRINTGDTHAIPLSAMTAATPRSLVI